MDLCASAWKALPGAFSFVDSNPSGAAIGQYTAGQFTSASDGHDGTLIGDTLIGDTLIGDTLIGDTSVTPSVIAPTATPHA
jgi:hypothetical protein